MPLQAKGEFALVKDELESALALSGQPVKRGTMAHKHIVYMMLVEAAAQMPDREVLPLYAAQLEELAVRDDHLPYLAVAHRAWGISHRLEGYFAEAEERLAKALAIFVELGAQWQIGRTVVEMAVLAQAQEDNNGARKYFSRALAEFESINAAPEIEQTKASLQSLG